MRRAGAGENRPPGEAEGAGAGGPLQDRDRRIRAMKIVVRLFAVLRDRAGASALELELADDASVEQAREELSVRVPAVAEFLSSVAFAVNQSYVDHSTVLHDGDELA